MPCCRRSGGVYILVALLNIAIVEDNDELREATVEALRGEGHSVIGVDCAEALPENVSLDQIDLAIIDLNLPGEDGLTLALRIRIAQPGIGIIIVTARTQSEQKLEGYRCGADIYMTKPVTLDVLLAAIQSLSRRLKPHGVTKTSDLELNANRMTLKGPTQEPVLLTPAEVVLLSAFRVASNTRLENWQVIEILQRENAEDPKSAVEIVIVRLRKKIHKAGIKGPSILSIRNWGYQLCVPLTIN